MSPILEIDIRRKAYPAVAGREEHVVLENVKVAIEPSSFVAITGPSGCGKTTLLNVVAGLDPDVEGGVRFAKEGMQLAYVFQAPRLLPWRTVEENLALPLPDGDARLARIPDMLERVGLAGQGTAYPERLSLGMQRRVALARAFLLEPDVLLMDEPFVSLDDPTAQGLRQLLIELWTRRPTTVLFVTHDRFEAVMLATRLLRIAGSPASIVCDSPIGLSPAARTDRAAVLSEQAKLFRDA